MDYSIQAAKSYSITPVVILCFNIITIHRFFPLVSINEYEYNYITGQIIAHSALHLAISFNKDSAALHIIKHIIRNGGSIDFRDDQKRTPLLLALELGKLEIAKCLYRGEFVYCMYYLVSIYLC